MKEENAVIPSKKRFKRLVEDYNSVAIVLLLLIIASFAVDGFNGKSVSTILIQASLYGFVALGLALVMITGNIDLSVGFQLCSAGIICVLVLNATGSMLLASLAALLVGAVTGSINGLVVTKIGVNPLIATIATNYIYKGFSYYFTENGSLTPTADYKNALNATAKFYQRILSFLCCRADCIADCKVFVFLAYDFRNFFELHRAEGCLT